MEAPYPLGGEGFAEVVVELLVSREGTPSEVHAVAGRAPFVEAAEKAVLAMTFDPATKDGATVAAKIRIPIRFVPAVDLPEDPYEAPLPVLPKNPYGDDTPVVATPIEHVEVTGQRRAAGKLSLGRAEVRDMPGAFGDAFRALEALPGVTPMASGLPFFFVRGAPPGSTGYFIDGIRLPVLFHLGAGPSVIHPALVDHIDFYPGSAPAAYGRASGGIVTAETRAPGDKLHGEGNVRLLDAGALVETPLPQGLGTVLAAGRFGYPGLLLPIFAPNTRLSYWDYQLRWVMPVGKEDSVSVLVLGSYDYLGRRSGSIRGQPTVSDPIGLGETERTGLETRTIFETEFSRIEARHDHVEKGVRTREAFIVGKDASALGLKDRVEAEMMGARIEAERPLGEHLLLRGGMDAIYQRYAVKASDLTLPNPEFEKLFPTRDELAMGIRGDVTYTDSERLKVTAGLRIDRYSAYRIEHVLYTLHPDPLSATRFSIEPRVSARVKVMPRVVFVSTAGIAGQPPRFVLPLPGLTVGRLAEGLERSAQTSHGIEWALPYAFSLTTTFFASRTVGLADVFAACPGARNAFTDGNACTERSTGGAFGLEVYIKRPFTERLTGFLSYTLSRSFRKVPVHVFGSGFRRFAADIDREAGAPVEIPSDYDRTHVFNAAVAYEIGRGYRAGVRFLYYSGRPYTPTSFNGAFLAAPNSRRMPGFYRLDLRLEKKWTFSQGRYVSAVLEGLNVTLRKEANGVTCGTVATADDVDLGDGCVADEIGPIAVPSIGIEAAF